MWLYYCYIVVLLLYERYDGGVSCVDIIIN